LTKKTLTTNRGIPVAYNQNSLTAGQRGPVLLQDVHLIEKLAHFDRERITERVVHAKGAGAHGYFQVCKSMAPYTKAKFLQDPEKKTPVLQQTAVLECICSNTVIIAAAEATVSQVGKGIFKSPQ
jgi:catalase